MAIRPGETNFIPGDELVASQYNLTNNTVDKLTIEDNERIVFPGDLPPANIADGHWVTAPVAGDYSDFQGIASGDVTTPSILLYSSTTNDWTIYTLSSGGAGGGTEVWNPVSYYSVNDFVSYGNLGSPSTDFSDESLYRCISNTVPGESPETTTIKWDYIGRVEELNNHIADATIHFTEAAIDHTAILNIGTHSHASIDGHIDSTSNPHSVDATDVGLGNVDNTSDVNKPISTATQAVIDTHIADTTTHGTTGDIVGTTDTQTLTSKTLTLPTIGDFTNANHDHSNTANGGTVDYTDITNIPNATEKLSISTSISWGGKLTINADPTKFDIAAGEAVIVDSYTDPQNPVFTTLTWGAQIGLTITNIATQLLTFIYLENSGGSPLFTQGPALLTTIENRDKVEIGVLVHENLTTASTVASLSNWSKDTDLKILDLSRALGTISLSGNVYFSSGAKKLSKTLGEAFSINDNRVNNAKTPNIVTSAAEDDMTFLTARGGVPSGVGFASDIDTDNYDPLGAGTLTAMPIGTFTTHGIFFSAITGLTIVHYGQFLYDSLKKAVQSWNFESYNVIPELDEVALMGVLAFKAGATSLTDPEQARFIKPSALGIKGTLPTLGYSTFAESVEIIDGMSYKRPSVTYVNDGGTIYADLEADGIGNMVYVFNQQEFILDCTTGSGVSGRARIALTAGVDSETPMENYIYATKLGANTAQLNASTSEPTGQFGWVAQVLLPDATTFGTTGPYSTQRNSDNKQHDGRGALSYEREKIRDLGVSYTSGVTPIITITPGAPDELDITTSGGVVKQLHSKTFPALDSAIDGFYIINHPTTPWIRYTDLEDITVDAQGNTLENKSFNLVFVGIASTADGTEYSKMGVLLPNATYSFTDLQNALQDVSNTAVTSVPHSLHRTAFLVARVTFKLKTGTWNNVIEDVLTPQTFFDLRGNPLGALAGGVGAPTVTDFLDSTFKIISNVDADEQSFLLDNLTANRVATMPDKDGTIAMLDDLGIVTISAAVSDETSNLIIGTESLTFRMPYAMTLSDVRASVGTAPTGSTLIVDINENASTVLSTKLSIDATEKTSTTAVIPPVISDINLVDDAEITIDIDQVGATIAGAGLKIYLIGKRI